MKWLLLVVLGVLAGCGASDGDSGGGSAGEPRPVMAPAEIKRSEDACKALVARACECAKTVPAAKQACDSAHALPDAIRVALEVAASPDSSGHDAKQTQKFVRDTVAECVEQTAKLPMLGCPP